MGEDGGEATRGPLRPLDGGNRSYNICRVKIGTIHPCFMCLIFCYDFINAKAPFSTPRMPWDQFLPFRNLDSPLMASLPPSFIHSSPPLSLSPSLFFSLGGGRSPEGLWPSDSLGRPPLTFSSPSLPPLPLFLSPSLHFWWHSKLNA